MLILTIIVLPLPSFTINWQFLKNIQAFAQNIKLARTGGTLTQLISRSNQMSNNSKNNINIAGVNITTDLKFLSSKVTETRMPQSLSAFAMLQLIKNLKWIAQGANITVLTDADVDNDLIFTKNRPTNAYDIIILDHQEYITQKRI